MSNTARKERQISTTVLVIGAGGAGLRAAIELQERGVDTLVLSKRSKHDAHTSLAAGGINAALATMPGDEADTWQQHAADTIKESYLLADPHTVQIVTEGAERGIADLERYGMPFEREADGSISQRFFGAHKYRRTAFASDYTGLEIQRTLVRRAAELNVPVLDNVYVTRILVKNNRVFGAYGFDQTTGERILVHCDAIILAAGGHNRIWRRTSSRADENTGDSWKLAVDAGARLRDPELVQFHPSGIIEPESEAGTLVSEAARGEGGILRNGLGERYMSKYDPERMELSTRDRVALAGYTEIAEGRGTEKGAVLLDVSHLPRETILRRLSRVYHFMLELQNVDITKQPIEIAPTAHYSMGGVWVRPSDHMTDVEGLYAIGEASSGLHGANRLGGNSLIELLVYGRIVADAAADYAEALEAQERSKAAVDAARAEVDAIEAADGEEMVRVLQAELRQLMTDYAGVVRSEEGLLQGLKELEALEARAKNIGVYPDIASYKDVSIAFDLMASLLAARATLATALERRETRGAHNRSDYPEMDAKLQGNFVWSPTTGVEFETIPAIPAEIAELMADIEFDKKLLQE